MKHSKLVKVVRGLLIIGCALIIGAAIAMHLPIEVSFRVFVVMEVVTDWVVCAGSTALLTATVMMGVKI